MHIVHRLDLENPAIYDCAQAGCEACLEALLRRHEGLLHAIVRRQWRGGMAYADVAQEGRIGLWQAIMHFDPHRGVAFSSYAWPAIERRLWRAVAVTAKQARAEQAGRHRVPSQLPDVVHMAEEALWRAQVRAALAELLIGRQPVLWRRWVVATESAGKACACGATKPWFSCVCQSFRHACGSYASRTVERPTRVRWLSTAPGCPVGGKGGDHESYPGSSPER
jgi:RNA polymerase sigma factor (sigma-70 family)